jgi:hypothetical protein
VLARLRAWWRVFVDVTTLLADWFAPRTAFVSRWPGACAANADTPETGTRSTVFAAPAFFDAQWMARWPGAGPAAGSAKSSGPGPSTRYALAAPRDRTALFTRTIQTGFAPRLRLRMDR